MPIPTAPTLLLAVGVLSLILGQWLQTSRWYGAVWLIAVAGTAVWLKLGDGGSSIPLSVGWSVDPLAEAGYWLALVTGTLFGLGAFGIQSRQDRTAQRFGNLSFLIAGAMLTASANDMIAMALSLELVQFASWGLRHADGLEQAQQPLEHNDVDRWLGVFSSGCLWLGIALLANVTASTEYDHVRQVLTDAYVPTASRTAIGSGSRLGLLGMGLMIAGLGSRIGLVPWQIGVLESGRSAKYWTAGCVIVVGQLSGVLALARLCGTVWIGYRGELLILLVVVSGLTFAASGSLAGLGLMPGEGRLRRWAGSITMLQGGWLTVGLMASVGDLASPRHSLASEGNQPGALALLLFAVGASQLGLAGLFLVLSHLARKEQDVEFVEELLGLGRLQPVAAGALVVVLASLIGHPPLWGFWSNWLMMISGLNVRAADVRETMIPHAGLIVVVIAGSITTLLTAGVMIRCAQILLLEQPMSRALPHGPRSALFVACGCALTLLAVGLFPARLLVALSHVRAPTIESGSDQPSGSSRGNATADLK